MRFADASLAAACLVQLFATAWGLPPPDQLLSNSPEIDNGFSGPPLHVYAQPALRKRQATTGSTSAATSPGTSVSSSSSSSSSGIYTNSTTSSTMSSTSSSMSSSANLTTSSTSSSTSSYANSTSSTASSTTSSSTTASASPTTVMGVTFNIQNNTIYSGTLLNLMRKRAADSGVDTCLNKCASNSSCQGTAYDNTTSTCTYYSSVDQSSQMTKNGTTFALVQNRASNTTSNSTTSAPSSTMTMSLNSTTSTPSSTMTMSLNSTSSLSRSTTRRMNTTSSHSMTMTANSTSSHSSTMSSNTTSSTSATPTNLVGARTCKQIAAAGSTFTDSNNVTYAVICSKMQKRMLLDESALSPRAAGDLATVQSGSFEGCAPYCDQNSQCNSFSYDPTNGTCYLESTSSVTQPVAGRDYAYKVQSTTSSSSTSSTTSTTSTTSSTTSTTSTTSTSSSSTSDFVPDGYSISKTTICDTPTGASIITASATPTPSTTSSSLLYLSSSSASSSTPLELVLHSTSLDKFELVVNDDFFAILDVINHLAFSSDKNRHRTVQTVVSQQTVGAVVTSYSVVSSGSTVTIVDTATSVLSIYTSTMQVASLRRSTVTTIQSAQPSLVTVGAVTVTTDVVVPSGYTTVTASGSTVTHNIDRTVATGVATVTAPASTVTTTVATLTTSGVSTVTSGISTVTMNAAPMSFLTVWRRDEKALQNNQVEEKKDEKKDEEKRDRSWFAFDGMTEFWM
ncbi:hypothetical protein KCU83_g8710, partial [Aureobasidium melanogenum]